MAIRVRPATAEDRQAWFGLWRGNCGFYGTFVPDAVSVETWERLLNPAQPMMCLLACGGGEVVGFANAVLHLNTWTTKHICYLEDLFVAPEKRGEGVGRALIQALAQRGRDEDWFRIYWMTKRDNAPARRLYDAITPVTDWVRYDLVP
jgi:GNAT superfamily N-acetyltransferase